MGLFRRRGPQEAFDGSGFTITRVIYQAPPLSVFPSVFADVPGRRWAVRFPGQEPVIFDNADFIRADVLERQPEDLSAISNRRLALEILRKPQAVADANAARRGLCLGLSVAVWASLAGGDPVRIDLPVLTEGRRRTSPAFRRAEAFAKELKLQLDSLQDGLGM